jgi:hypothetical protein
VNWKLAGRYPASPPGGLEAFESGLGVSDGDLSVQHPGVRETPVRLWILPLTIRLFHKNS